MGVYPLIEIYLFINPLSCTCLEVERKILKEVHGSQNKIDLHILPIVNPQVVAAAFLKGSVSLARRNHYFHLAYQIALDFKAAQVQGKKYAREFLLALQQHLLVNQEEYSNHLIRRLFKQTGGDVAMFLEDRSSNLVKEKFWQDQKTAREMQIREVASAVVYNFSTEGAAILLEGPAEIQSLPRLGYLQASSPSLSLYAKKKAYK